MVHYRTILRRLQQDVQRARSAEGGGERLADRAYQALVISGVVMGKQYSYLSGGDKLSKPAMTKLTRKMRALLLDTLLKWKQAMEVFQAVEANYKAQEGPQRPPSGRRDKAKRRDHGYRRSPDQPPKQAGGWPKLQLQEQEQEEEERQGARERELERERERRHPHLASKVLSTVDQLMPYQRHIDLSVVIPCHNVGGKIGGLVEVLLEGTRPLEIEVLLVEDSSSDVDPEHNGTGSSSGSNTVPSSMSLTWREVSRLANTHTNVYAFPTNVPGGGAGRARNSAIPLLEGRFTFFMDGDDGLNVANLVAAVRHMT